MSTQIPRDRPAEDEIMVTPSMIAAGVHILTGFNLDPYFQEVVWEHIVRDVYLSMMAARQLARLEG